MLGSLLTGVNLKKDGLYPMPVASSLSAIVAHWRLLPVLNSNSTSPASI